jgi:ABC-type multidrug transport system permease subunit
MATRWSSVSYARGTDGMAGLALVTLGGWLICTLAVLLYFSLFTIREYFVIAFIGLLAIAQVFAPVQSSPRWWVILRRLVILGYAVFTLVIVEYASEMIF